MSKKNPPPNIIEIPVKSLYVPAYYRELFPLERDRTALKTSITRRGFLAEHAIVVRPKTESRKEHEIVAGVGRWEVMLELESETIPAIVKEELSDADARAYTACDNLQASRTATRLSVAQAIVLALDYAEQSKTRYDPKLVTLAANTSPATHRRAMESLNYALDVLRAGMCKNIADASIAKIVAEALKYAKVEGSERANSRRKEVDAKSIGDNRQSDNGNDMRLHRWIDFEDFYTGKLAVKTFKDMYYAPSERAAEHRRQQHRMVTAHAGENKNRSLQSDAVAPEYTDVPITADIAKTTINVESIIAEWTEAEAFRLIALLAARLSPKLSSGKKLPPEFAEILRTANVDTNAVHRLCDTVAKHLKLPAKTASQSLPGLFDSSLPDNATP